MVSLKIKINTVEKIKHCIDCHESFVLQGGAGSGKTETLKAAIEHTLLEPNNKILCITHTNAAVNEIKRRINGDYDIFTIHSFLNTLIKNFKVNIKEELIKINKLEKLQKIDVERYKNGGNVYRQERHKLYKMKYEKYSLQLYKRSGKSLGKVENKMTYDNKYVEDGKQVYNGLDIKLNNLIDRMNEEIEDEMEKVSVHKVHYSNRNFDIIQNLAYGHDSLLIIATNLLNQYPKLQRILQSKYDYIFIDEYQDTNPEVIRGFIDKFISNYNTIGLFGDSMQSIYDDGIGDVRSYIESGRLKEIQKEDNFRSSYEVVDFINLIRTDGLKQEVALKKGESESDRIGDVKFYYVIQKFGKDQKGEQKVFVKKFKEYVLKDKKEFITLELSNSAIAEEMRYSELYSHYKSANDINEEILEDLTRLHLKELYEIITAFKDKNYNMVIAKLRDNGWILRKMSDKQDIIKVLNNFIDKDLAVNEALELAFENKVLKKSDSYHDLISKIKLFFEDLNNRESYDEFKRLINEGYSTFNKMQRESTIISSEEQFDEYINLLNKEKKYTYLMNRKFKLNEAFNFLKYQLDKNNISTMHRTKGEGIKNVAVILDNYQWHKYNFDKMFDEEYFNESVKGRTQKLFYVACSRTIKKLILIKVMKDESELEMFQNKFSPELFHEIKAESILETYKEEYLHI